VADASFGATSIMVYFSERRRLLQVRFFWLLFIQKQEWQQLSKLNTLYSSVCSSVVIDVFEAQPLAKLLVKELRSSNVVGNWKIKCPYKMRCHLQSFSKKSMLMTTKSKKAKKLTTEELEERLSFVPWWWWRWFAGYYWIIIIMSADIVKVIINILIY